VLKNRIRELRSKRDWSQGRLAKELGVSRQTVNAIEQGKQEPALSLAYRIALLFEAQIEKIFFPEDDDDG
jgi:putative transcriptional regulator